MTGVHVAFERLEVIAVVVQLRDIAVLGRNIETFESGKEGRLSRSEISENDPGLFLTRIGEVFHFVLEVVGARLGGLLETSSADVEKPAVIETAKPPVLDAPHTEISTTMWTVESEKPRPSLVVAEHDEIFSEQADA